MQRVDRETRTLHRSGKEQVKTHRLKEPDKTKYEVYNTIKDTLPKCKNWDTLTNALQKHGIETQFKYKGQSDEKQGIIFSKGEYSFNGSKVNRQFSYSKIDYQLKVNSQDRNKTISHSTSMDSSLESVASLATMEQHGEDFDEIAFANRMDYEEKERQHKKKRGLRF